MPLPNTAHLYGTDPVPTWVQHLAALEAQYNLIRQGIGQQDESELTIAAGVVTPTLGEHTVDTEADAASDDLTTIATTNFVAGQWLKLRAAHTDRTVVVKHNAGGAGKMTLQDGADFALDDDKKWILLKRVGADWVEVLRNAGTEPLVLHKVQAWSTDQTAGVTQRGKTIVYSGAVARTLSFAAVATLGDGWFAFVRNDMTAVLTLDPNGAEAIDGVTTIRLFPGDSAIVGCDGTALRTFSLSRGRLYRQAKTGAYAVVAGDGGTLIDATSGTWSLTLPAVAGLPAGFLVAFKNSGAGIVTVDPNAAETIDGVATLDFGPGESAMLLSTGTAWITLFRAASGSVPNGAMVWRTHTALSSVVTVNAAIPADDSAPQSGEGVAVLSHVHTRPPGALATNKLLVRVTVVFGSAGGTPTFIVALFKDAEASARTAAIHDGTAFDSITLEFEMTAGGTGNITFSIRAGASGGTIYVNGDSSGTRLFGAISKTIITVEEVKA